MFAVDCLCSFRSCLRPVSRTAACLLAAALVVACGCTSGPGEPGPDSSYGAIEGYVLECGTAVPSVLDFTPRNAANVDARARVTPDSTGWYRVELPVGDYRVTVRMVGEQVWSTYTSSESDTVRVGRSVRRRDFQRGRALVAVRLPASLEGSTVSVLLYRPGISVELNTNVVDGLAVCDLRLVPMQSYVMRLNPGGSGAWFFLPGTHLIADADSLRVGASPVTHESDTRGRFARLEGRVTGSWQATAQSMEVHAYAPGQARRAAVGCDADGSFRLDLIAPVYVRLVTRCGGVDRWFGGASYATATWHQLEPGQVVAGLEMREGGLRLRFDGPGSLVDNVGTVALVHPDGTRLQVSLGPANPALLSNLAAGDYRLQLLGGCALDPWVPQWFDGAVEEADALPLTVVEGAFTDATIRQEAGGVLRGAFVGDPDVEFEPRHISLYRGDGTPLCGGSFLFWSGFFEWPGLADGEYLLGTRVSGETWWFPGTWELDAAERLTIVDGGTVAGLAWLVPSEQIVIRK